MEEIANAIEHIFTLDLFALNDEGRVPIPHFWTRSDSPLYLVLGPNGSGKSFFRRLLGQAIKDLTSCKDVLSTSMQGRTSEHTHRFLHYGFEENQSTGLNSTAATLAAIRAAQMRKSSNVLMFDEPDIGLDPEGSAGLGVFLSEFLGELPEHTQAVFVSSHSPELIRRLASREHNYIYLGKSPAPETVWEWLDRDIEPRMPETLRTIATTRYSLIEDVIKPSIHD